MGRWKLLGRGAWPLGLGFALAVAGCSFDFTGFHDGNGGGEAVASSSSEGPAASTASAGGAPATSAASTTTTSALSTSEMASSSTGSLPEVPACGDIADTFSSVDFSNGLWNTNGPASFDGSKALVALEDHHDFGGFTSKGEHTFALKECFVSIKIDMSGVDITHLDTHGVFEYGQDSDHRIQLELHVVGALLGHLHDGTDTPIAPDVYKGELRFREQGGQLFVETRDPGTIAWDNIDTFTSPAWLNDDTNALLFGAGHSSSNDDDETVSFDDVNTP